jgi:predicted ester cyclase
LRHALATRSIARMTSTSATNASATRRYYEALWNQRDLAVITDWIAPDYIGHFTAKPEPVRGIAGFRAMAEELFTAFPDLRMSLADVIAEGDRVASRVLLEGTHRGEMLGYAPTGLRVETSFLAIERYVDGLCVEEWVYSDDLGLGRQIKALPAHGSRLDRFGKALHRLTAGRARGDRS